MKKWIALLVVLVLALAVYVAAGPYLTVRAIRHAVQAQDAAALADEVDFPLLRASLKAQLEDRMLRRAGAEAQADPIAAFGLSLASGAIDGAVELMATPSGLAALMEGRAVWKRIGGALPGAPDPDAPRIEPLHDAVYRFESTSRFTATVRDRHGAPYAFVLHRDGIRWKLADIRLPP